MEIKAAHTPTPWTKDWLDKQNEPTEVEEANVEFMLKAVNSYEADQKTIQILKRMLEKATGWTASEIAKEIIIAQTKGEIK